MKIKNYDLACFSYGKNPKKLKGSYMASINLDNKVTACYVKVSDPEEGLTLIKNLIKGYEFVVEPDLTIKESNHLGKHIFSKHHEK